MEENPRTPEDSRRMACNILKNLGNTVALSLEDALQTHVHIQIASLTELVVTRLLLCDLVSMVDKDVSREKIYKHYQDLAERLETDFTAHVASIRGK